MTNDEVFTTIQQQNEAIINLLARLAWTPEKIAEIAIRGKRNPEAYIKAYNALDGSKTVTHVATLGGVTQQTMSVMLQSWLDEGIVLNVGTDGQPKYKRLMRIQEIRKKGRRDATHDQ
jgi:hypothetical protein